MNRFIKTLAIVTVSLTLVAAAQADGRCSRENGRARCSRPFVRSRSVRSPSCNNFNSFNMSNGPRNLVGPSYKGKYQHHWTSCYYNQQYGCYLYFDPDSSRYFYYCDPDDCYYPITYSPYQRFTWGPPVSYFRQEQSLTLGAN